MNNPAYTATQLAFAYYSRLDKPTKQAQAGLVVWSRHHTYQQGHAQAQNALSYLYDTGYGTQQDYQQARYWYEQAAKQGDKYTKKRLKHLTHPT